MIDNAICANCKFCEILPSTREMFEDTHVCRRHAPTPTNNWVGEEMFWPVVDAEDWCGEYAKGGFDG